MTEIIPKYTVKYCVFLIQGCLRVESLIVDRLVNPAAASAHYKLRNFTNRNMNSHGQFKWKLAPSTAIALLLLRYVHKFSSSLVD